MHTIGETDNCGQLNSPYRKLTAHFLFSGFGGPSQPPVKYKNPVFGPGSRQWTINCELCVSKPTLTVWSFRSITEIRCATGTPFRRSAWPFLQWQSSPNCKARRTFSFSAPATKVATKRYSNVIPIVFTIKPFVLQPVAASIHHCRKRPVNNSRHIYA